MGLFDYIFRKITPANVATRYQVVIYNFQHFSFGVKVSIISDYKVVLISPKVNDGEDYDEEVRITLEQKFNSEDIKERKTLRVTVDTTLEDRPINVKLMFNDSTAQLDIFQSILTATRNRLLEVQEDLNRAKQKRQNTLSDVDITNELLTQKMKEKGLTVDENKFKKEYEKIDNEVYDGSKDEELNYLTIDQKYAFLILAVSLCFSNNPDTNVLTDSQYSILKNFANTLKLDSVFLSNIITEKHYLNTNAAIEEVKAIHMDAPFLHFIMTCYDILLDVGNDIWVKAIYKSILRKIGLSNEDIEATFHCEYHFRFDNYKEEEKEEVNNKKEATIVQSWSLLDFARKFDKMQLGTFYKEELNIIYKECVFTLNGIKTYVSFSPDLGELTVQEIKDRKYQLKVAKLSNGNYILYE